MLLNTMTIQTSRQAIALSLQAFSTDSLAEIVSDSLYLLGILNSRICHYLIFKSAAERQGGFVEFKPMYISPLPIPEPPANETISEIVSRILSLIRQNQPDEILSLKKANAECSHHEACLDANVAHLYRLTAAEYDLILSDLKLSDTFRESCRAAFRIEK